MPCAGISESKPVKSFCRRVAVLNWKSPMSRTASKILKTENFRLEQITYFKGKLFCTANML